MLSIFNVAAPLPLPFLPTPSPPFPPTRQPSLHIRPWAKHRSEGSFLPHWVRWLRLSNTRILNRKHCIGWRNTEHDMTIQILSCFKQGTVWFLACQHCFFYIEIFQINKNLFNNNGKLKIACYLYINYKAENILY